MFIFLDTDPEGLVPFYDHVNELDDKSVIALSDLDELTDYRPDGDFHVVDTFDELKDKLGVVAASDISRWAQLRLATIGARIYTDSFNEDSPVWAGPVPSLDKVRKISVDGAFAEGRASYFAKFGVNYIGRTKLDPRNIFVLDNKKGNPFHDPAKDETLEALYASLPDDWWGSCGFVSTGNVERLEAFFDAFPDIIPLAFTTGAFSKLKYIGREYVEMNVPNGTPEYGITARESSNRLSYKLSEPEAIEGPTDTGWLQL